jgi:hypothetical protein
VVTDRAPTGSPNRECRHHGEIHALGDGVQRSEKEIGAPEAGECLRARNRAEGKERDVRCGDTRQRICCQTTPEHPTRPHPSDAGAKAWTSPQQTEACDERDCGSDRPHHQRLCNAALAASPHEGQVRHRAREPAQIAQQRAYRAPGRQRNESDRVLRNVGHTRSCECGEHGDRTPRLEDSEQRQGADCERGSQYERTADHRAVRTQLHGELPLGSGMTEQQRFGDERPSRCEGDHDDEQRGCERTEVRR